MGRFDALTQLEETQENKTPLSAVHSPRTTTPQTQTHKKETPTKKDVHRISIKKESHPASTLASNHDSMIETIRKTVKSLGKEVSFTRVTPEEKGMVADIVYTYKRQGTKTSENEINRIAMNFLMEDFHTHGKDSVLAQVIEALNA